MHGFVACRLVIAIRHDARCTPWRGGLFYVLKARRSRTARKNWPEPHCKQSSRSHPAHFKTAAATSAKTRCCLASSHRRGFIADPASLPWGMWRVPVRHAGRARDVGRRLQRADGSPADVRADEAADAATGQQQPVPAAHRLRLADGPPHPEVHSTCSPDWPWSRSCSSLPCSEPLFLSFPPSPFSLPSSFGVFGVSFSDVHTVCGPPGPITTRSRFSRPRLPRSRTS